MPTITFIPCQENQAHECAEPSEIEEFLKTNKFILSAAHNFVELDRVRPLDQSLDRVLVNKLAQTISFDEPKFIRM